MAAVACLVLIAGVVAGCGDDEGDDTTSTEAADATDVTVTAEEYSFDLSATPTAATTEITFDNAGQEPHALVFARINEGFTAEEAIELEGKKGSGEVVAQTGAKPGEQAKVQVKQPLEAGEYALLCPIVSADGPHWKLGQLEEFSIE